jgi:hypothetical protein
MVHDRHMSVYDKYSLLFSTYSGHCYWCSGYKNSYIWYMLAHPALFFFRLHPAGPPECGTFVAPERRYMRLHPWDITVYTHYSQVTVWTVIYQIPTPENHAMCLGCASNQIQASESHRDFPKGKEKSIQNIAVACQDIPRYDSYIAAHDKPEYRTGTYLVYSELCFHYFWIHHMM